MSDARQLIKDPKVLGALASIGIVGIPILPILIFGPFWWVYALWAFLIKPFVELQRKKKIRAIMEGFPGRYNEHELDAMSRDNRQEFNRLFKLASDEFFRKYVQEQADHKKVQILVIELQKRIEAMRERVAAMEKKEGKHREEIEILKEEIKIYEETFNSWQGKAA